MLKRLNRDYSLTILLLILILSLVVLNLKKAEPVEVESTDNIVYDKSQNVIKLSSLTIKQKIAQMIMTYGKEENKEALQNLNIGGIYLGAKISPSEFIKSINYFQNGTAIPFFISVDLEICTNPFQNFQYFPSQKEIKTKEEAFELGINHGKLLKELGFNINFAPVVDLGDIIWDCRNFLGTPEEVSEKAVYYINGLQSQGIIATAKHYPGKTLNIADPHKYTVKAEIGYDDLLPFERSIKNNVSAIMIDHVITSGIIDSDSKPSVVSDNLVNDLKKNFTGLIITDEIRMLGLKNYYPRIEDMYIDLFKVGNDVILNFDTDINNLYYMISVVEKAVKDGNISEKRIDDSVILILNMKGIKVIR
jgi:beta-N-acetylhexosaminidase